MFYSQPLFHFFFLVKISLESYARQSSKQRSNVSECKQVLSNVNYTFYHLFDFSPFFVKRTYTQKKLLIDGGFYHSFCGGESHFFLTLGHFPAKSSNKSCQLKTTQKVIFKCIFCILQVLIQKRNKMVLFCMCVCFGV